MGITQTKKIENLISYTYLPYNYSYNLAGNYYYSGYNINNPQIGDIRISYSYAPSDFALSVVGIQTSDNKIMPKLTKDGNVYLQYDGILTLNDILAKFQEQSTTKTNIFRLIGFLFMFFGLLFFVKPMLTIASFIPFLQTILGGISFVAILFISLILSLSVIAVAWLAFRPLLSIGLFAIIVVLIVAITKLANRNSL